MLIALAVLAIDLLTKSLATRFIAGHASGIDVLGGLLRWTYVRNYGSAFSLIQGGRLFFIGFSILSILLIVAMALFPRYRRTPYTLSLGLILGGAIGNLVDRVLLGAVRDFIDIGIGRHRWPTFNVADIGVTVGVGLLAVLLLFPRAAGEDVQADRETDRDSDLAGAS